MDLLGAPHPTAEGLPGSAGEHELQLQCATSDRAQRFYADQVLDHLNAQMREFVARQEMAFIATSDSNGECDSTFRAGPPGFLVVLNERTLAYPEYNGNGVLASLGNIKENGHLAILLIDFFSDLIGLHVNGTACLIEDKDLRRTYPELPPPDIPGRRARLWVVVGVEEAYIHCSKHIPRLARLPRRRQWGTDDPRLKCGDYFGVKAGQDASVK